MNEARGIALATLGALAVLATAGAAAVAPLWTYALSLALFGLPHVLVELRYVDQRFHARLPVRTVVLLGALLAGIVLCRVLALGGVGTAVQRTTTELLLGALLVAAALPAFARSARPAVALATLLPLGLGLALAPLDTLVLLAWLHNLTPVGFLAERLCLPQRRRALGLCALVFGAVPLLLATGALRGLLAPAGEFGLDDGPFGSGSIEAHLPAFVLPGLFGPRTAVDLFAAAAYLQCMHYAVVLHVLPRLSGGGETAGARLPWPRRGFVAGTAAAGALMAAAFAGDFVGARALYAVAAALHAWIEIPVLLLACAVPPRGAPARAWAA